MNIFAMKSSRGPFDFRPNGKYALFPREFPDSVIQANGTIIIGVIGYTDNVLKTKHQYISSFVFPENPLNIISTTDLRVGVKSIEEATKDYQMFLNEWGTYQWPNYIPRITVNN